MTRYPKPYALGATKNPVGWLNLHAHSLFDFLSNVARHANGEPMHPDSPSFADGLAAQRVVAACQTSSANNGAWTAV